MAFLLPNVDRSTLLFGLVTGLALLTRIVLAAVTTCLATTDLTTRTIFPLAITASVFDIFAVVTFLAATGLFLRRVSRGLILAAWMPGAASSLIGTILSLITLATAIAFSGEHSSRVTNDETSMRSLAATGLAIGIVGLFPETAFFVLIWPQRKEHTPVPVENVQELPAPTDTIKRRSIIMQLATIGPKSPRSFFSHDNGSRPASPRSPSMIPSSPSGRSSLRDSASNALRPMTSRTRLILHTSFASSKDTRSVHSGEPIAAEAMRSTDEFENWDTSKVEQNPENPFQQHRTRLEPIPGSRPVSPAHALDGPYLEEPDATSTLNKPLPDAPILSPEEKPLPDSPILSPVASPVSETGSLRNFPRSLARRPSHASGTSQSDQAHIHPLFRSESPAPPPLASPGTVIHASPYAGQVITPELALMSPRLLGSAHGSRPSSPLVTSPIRSRPGSVKSFRSLPTSPVDAPEEPPLPVLNRNISQLSHHLAPPSPISPND